MHSLLWSHRLRAFSANEIPTEELEALSRRYSSATILLLPLVSGRVALFDNARVFRLIADEDDLTHSTLSRLSSEWEAELRAETAHAERLHSMGLGEPSAKRLVRDIRKADITLHRSLGTDTELIPLDLDSI
jgi:hypothetical protein